MSGNSCRQANLNGSDRTQKEVNLRVINIGLQHFYEALVSQKVKTMQLEWRPPVKQSAEITAILDQFL
jgi:hypothetical protein